MGKYDSPENLFLEPEGALSHSASLAIDSVTTKTRGIIVLVKSN